jgi:4-hydroxy-2-oxoheptanedioate aldolase
VFENKVKQKLARGETAWGASAIVADPLANQLVISTGIDFLWIDTEHSSFGVNDLSLLPVLARRAGCVPMVRVTGLDGNLIKKALDAGASTVMVPQINNADEARKAVRAAMYPPRGERGVSPLWTFYENVTWEDYLPRANDEICMVLQIESLEGSENLEAIAAVDGADVLFAGPADLAAALGVIGQMSHPKLKDFLAEFPQRVAKTGRAAGISVGSLEAARLAHAQGYRFISFGNLLFSGATGLTRDLKELRATCD